MKYLLIIPIILIGCGDNNPTYSNIPVSNPITIVQFCKGFTSTYPSIFPEVGLCINNIIYAVYYATNNVGLVALPNGNYTTTLDNAPCNFTVMDNCQIK